MKVKEIEVGQYIRLGAGSENSWRVKAVEPANEPDRLIIRLVTGKLERVYSMHKEAEILNSNEFVFIDAKEISEQFAVKLRDKIERGTTQYGSEVWQGQDPIDHLEEELLDALVYTWVTRRAQRVPKYDKLDIDHLAQAAYGAWRDYTVSLVPAIVDYEERDWYDTEPHVRQAWRAVAQKLVQILTGGAS